jgi:multidrug efflux pump subunit AcrA (membrane-fusion protein)
MTLFGKILVFLNLIFSVVTGALIVYVFTTRANWVAAYADAKQKVEASEVRYQAERTAHDSDRKQFEESLKAAQAQNAQLAAQVQAAQDEANRLRGQADTQTALTNASATEVQKQQSELAQIRIERDRLVEEKDVQRKRVVDIQVELDKQRKIAVEESLQAKNLLQRVTNLLRTVEELTARNRELEANAPGAGGAGGAGGTRSVYDEPAKSAPPGVYGAVTGISDSGALAQINIGSDSGLSPGNVLTVYRGKDYVGDLTLTATEAKTAVGKFTPARRTSKIQKEDSVTTGFGSTPK